MINFNKINKKNKCFIEENNLHLCENLKSHIRDDATNLDVCVNNENKIYGVSLDNYMINFCPFCGEVIFKITIKN